MGTIERFVAVDSKPVPSGNQHLLLESAHRKGRISLREYGITNAGGETHED